MLTTSKKTNYQNLYLLVAVLALAIVSVIALSQSGVLPAISVGQPATQNLSTLSAAEASAYRWDAMAKFYARQAAAQNLTTLSAAEASAYRWDAMAKFYAGQASPAANLSWPARPDFSQLNQQNLTALSAADASAYRWDAIARFYAGQAPAFHYTAPGR
jgi:hypothetical protein